MRVVLCVACRRGSRQQLPGWADAEAAAHPLPIKSPAALELCCPFIAWLCPCCEFGAGGTSCGAKHGGAGQGLTWALSSAPTGPRSRREE